jgi:hypothetical protein
LHHNPAAGVWYKQTNLHESGRRQGPAGGLLMLNLSVEITGAEQELLFAAAIVVCYGAVAAMS